MVTGAAPRLKGSIANCEICILGKQVQRSHQRVTELSKNPLDLILSDDCGKMRVQSIGGTNYFATFIDDCTRYVEVAFLRAKSDVKKEFLKFKNLAETKQERRIKILRTDGCLEYQDEEFAKALDESGIERQTTAPYTPQMNGIAERMNRTLVEMARCHHISASLPMTFWAEAIATAAYIRNRSPTSVSDITPYEKLTGKKPSVKHLRVFGQKAYALNKADGKGKFDNRSYKCTFLGYSPSNKMYKLWNTETRRIILSSDVTFG